MFKQIKYYLYLRAIIHSKICINRVFGYPSHNNIPVVICLWRKERFAMINRLLADIDKQTGHNNIDIFFWNNNYSYKNEVERLLMEFQPKGKIASLNIHHSKINIGGIGRFYMLRFIARSFGYKYGVMIDDDQQIGSHFIIDLLKFARPHTYASTWSFKIKGSYWDRIKLKNGEAADYCGTGGSIIDCTAFDSKEIILRLPIKYLFIEDLWISWYLKNNGWNLLAIESEIITVGNDTDQYHDLMDLKPEFYNKLTNK